MKQVFARPESMFDKQMHYCPGCGHGILHRIVAEVIDELGIRERAVGVAPVGCSVLIYDYINCDMYEAAHGRAPAVATGCKRVNPDLIVFTYQGDGDLASIGISEIIHAANRGERITTIFVNNAIYGMTGGQMAPTTLLGQKTTTSPFGRAPDREGYPIKVSELLSVLDGSAYIARGSLSSPQKIIQVKRYVKKAFETQIKNIGFALVEVLSMCPTNWGMSPVDAQKWVAEEMEKLYPLGEFKVPKGE
ncbi:MAG: 2-oxoglutarate oxidoreductase [Synergistetes bacterium]|nr:2-oxoglutarate oxidoreductase [Synergistota bacterium]